jgi:hypothetical protein
MTDATWQSAPGSSDYDTGANWVGGNSPSASGTATFGDSNKQSLTFSINDDDGWCVDVHDRGRLLVHRRQRRQR